MKSNKHFTILIADDDPDDLEYLKFLFEKHEGFTLLDSVNDGQAVIDYVEHSKPDILLIDMYMPKMTGSEVIKVLEKKNLSDDMSIFIISGTANDIEKMEFKAVSKIKSILKPTNLSQINDLPELLLGHLHAGHINRI